MVDLQPEQRERTLNCMKKLYQSLEFFYQLVNDDKLSEENVRTHMGLYESYFTELSDILGYDSAIAEERRSRYTEIRTLREQLQASLTERSKTITADELSEKLNHLDDIFRVWYSSLGFHYASQEKDHTENVPVYSHTGTGKRTILQLCSKRMQEIYGRMGNCSNQQKRRLGHF